MAHPNIALVKYWGKQTAPGNLPATPSVSVTLSALETTTRVETAAADRLLINDVEAVDPKIAQFLDLLRRTYPIPPLHIDTHNNFPTGAGLASSASGFAALTTAINAHSGLQLDTATLSGWARCGSASAARSMFAGFVSLQAPHWQAHTIADDQFWPLDIVVAITDESVKSVSSSVGMENSRLTSPFYPAWVETCADDHAYALTAIRARDFEQLSAIAEHSCLKMHAMMLATQPALAYWKPATVAAMQSVRALRAEGVPVFFTIDAGPQLKAICLPGHADTVEAALSTVNGVTRTLRCGLGTGARVVST